MFCLGPPFIKNALGERRQGWKKFGLCDNCYQMLSLSVIQRKETEEERLVKKKREKKRHCNFCMNFSTAAWTLSMSFGFDRCSVSKFSQSLPFLPSTPHPFIIQKCPMVGCAYFLCLHGTDLSLCTSPRWNYLMLDLMWQWGGVTGSVWVCQAWHCKRKCARMWPCN